MQIKKVTAYEILDSRGNPTIEVIMESMSNNKVVAAVPSGASTGIHEALELRDGDAGRYNGKGVLQAIANIEEKINPQIIGQEFVDQAQFDSFLIELDGTENKSNLGANTILALSLAFCKLQAADKELELYDYINQEFSLKEMHYPTPMVNILNGGQHADNPLQIQEFMILPVGIEDIAEKIRACAEIFHTLKKILKKEGLATGLGDEGGFAPDLKNPRVTLDFLIQAIEQASYSTGQIKIAMDVAASEFFEEGQYLIEEGQERLNYQEMIAYFQQLVVDYPIISIEDPLDQDDWLGWTDFTKVLGDSVQVVGDDFLVTNQKRLEKAINQQSANAILIKLNQIGTVSETVETIKLAQENGWSIMVSHRSGETNDTFIADLAYGMGAEFIKTGSMSRGERLAKYNRLLQIKATE